MKRNFSNWLSSFRESIASYDYYVDFKKIVQNVEKIKIELNILNTLIGSKNVEEEFKNIVSKYPETLKCIPILLAVRGLQIFIQDNNSSYLFHFNKMNLDISQYQVFMRETGLFDMLSKHLVGNLWDYVLGVETGLDSNGRKNRGGHLMENLVESHIKSAGFVKGISYFKEMYLHEIISRWGLNLSAISNQGKAEKRFDFVIKTDNNLYAIETNFYGSGGSKLNETARSYKTLALEAESVPNFHFVWITDGKGWISARNNLEETFDIMEHIYCIQDLENGIFRMVFI